MGRPAQAEALSFAERTGERYMEAGSAAWLFAAYVGPIVSLVRSPYGRVYTLLHGAVYLGVLVCISHLWWAAQRIEGRSLAGDLSPSAWLSAFAAPLFW